MKYVHNGRPNRNARREARLAQKKVRAIAAEIAWESTLERILEDDRRQQLINEAQDAIVAAQLEQDAEFLALAEADADLDRALDHSGVLH